VALGAHDEQATGLQDLVVLLLHARLDRRQHVGHALVEVGVARLEPQLGQLEPGQVLGVAAELDVHAAAGHVRRDGHGAGLAGLGDDLRLALGVLGLGVEDRVRDAAGLELRAQ
jgi:hypothetical protein